MEDAGKFVWLQARLQGFIDDGDVLVFASTKVRVDELSQQLQSAGVRQASHCPHHLDVLFVLFNPIIQPTCMSYRQPSLEVYLLQGCGHPW